MLDLSSYQTVDYYEVRLIDGTELQLNRPTQAMIEYVINIETLSNADKNAEAIKAFTNLFARILNRNINGKTFKAEELAEQYDFAVVVILIKDYFNYWKADTEDKVAFR